MEYTLYHASTESFNYFDENKIKAYETDAPYNGFWFSSDKRTSPSFRAARYLKTCTVTLNNPAPHKVIKEVVNELADSNLEAYRSLQDAVRITLKGLGYDGIVFNHIPQIDESVLLETGVADYRTARGTHYRLKIDTEFDGLDLYHVNAYGREDHITGYDDLADFLSQQEQTIIVFDNNQVKILEEKKLG